ncbi:hypothetical protein J437_LFUL006208 [Ladona fulva]|uniref:Cadherin domain-containing protein n=1 Tax=Ladona fulva TaxID=123851 RepID=A0A8K0NZU8_LADFU|nr:hypothetical protein J437_LFUL006208 [Ladona fulva]
MVKIQLTDVNDNRPTFYPREYNVSLREEDASGGGESPSPVVVVAATDPDSGAFGSVSYAIVAGNEAGLFRVDRRTGEIFVARPPLPPSRSRPLHHLNVSATDGAGLRAVADAEVFVSVVDSRRRPPVFERPRYNLSAREDAPRGSVIGSVRATSGNTDTRRRRIPQQALKSPTTVEVSRKLDLTQIASPCCTIDGGWYFGKVGP